MKNKLITDARDLIGLITVLLSFGALFTLIFHPVPLANTHLVDISIGVLLGGAVTGVIGYFFTQSIKDKINKEE